MNKTIRIISLALATLAVLNTFGCGGREKMKKTEPIIPPTVDDKYKHDETFTDYVWSKKNVDTILSSKYLEGMPLGYNDLVFSFYQSGWGFSNSSIHANVTLNEVTYDSEKIVNSGWAMPVQLKINGISVSVKDADFTPSHVTSYYSDSKGISVTGYKYVSTENMIAVIIEVKNGSEEKVNASVRANLGGNLSGTKADGNSLIAEFVREGNTVLDLVATGEGFKADGRFLNSSVDIAPGKTYTFKLGTAFERENADINVLKRFFKDNDPIERQKINFNAWFEYNVPYIDIPDESIEQTYYFRWYSFRNHIRLSTSGSYVITEFLPNVSWARNDNAIVCAAGHHIYEGRWLRDETYMNDYTSFWLGTRGQSALYLYSSWLPEAIYQRYLVTGDSSIAKYYRVLELFYDNFEASKFDSTMGLFKINGGSEGMECSISDPNNRYQSFRPTFNSYMYANALAIAEFAKIQGDTARYNKFIKKAEDLKTAMEKLWDGSFYRAWHYGEDAYCDVRELIGYAPWMFNMPDDDAEHAEIWKYLMDPDYFYAEYGPLTAEREKAILDLIVNTCRWDGPSWPFATTQTLIAMDNLLNNYENQSYITAEDYYTMLRNYALTHYRDFDGDGIRETPFIGENLLPDTGEWIQKRERSSNYNHSQYTNLIITGLIGITPNATDVLEISPLVPEDWEYFCLENLPYHGKNITVIYDKDGTRYGQGSGFMVYVDGKLVYNTDSLGKISVPLE